MRPRRPPVRLAECSLCHEPIVWIELDSGKRMPLNPVPVEPDDTRGNVLARVLGSGPRRSLWGWVESKTHPAEPYMLRMIPHVSTCVVVRDRTSQPRPVAPTLFDLEETQ